MELFETIRRGHAEEETIRQLAKKHQMRRMVRQALDRSRSIGERTSGHRARTAAPVQQFLAEYPGECGRAENPDRPRDKHGGHGAAHGEFLAARRLKTDRDQHQRPQPKQIQ